MFVCALIALLTAVAVAGFIRARKRAQATRIRDDLRLIDDAIDQYAMETGRKNGDPVAISDWTQYVKNNMSLHNTGADIFGNSYGAQTVDQIPSVPDATYRALDDVVDDEFWQPYGHP